MWKAKGVTLLVVCGSLVFCLGDGNTQPQVADNNLQLPPAQQGVDVQARGPIHEAFASPTAEPQVSTIYRKKPPSPIDEMPPEEKPEGQVVWISGYWAHDEDRQDFLWVSGCWRAKPHQREWVPGYWREQDGGWQWVSGFWGVTHQTGQQVGQLADISYQPAPPAPPQVAPPGPPPAADTFYMPGGYVWVDGRYGWRAGYWTRVQPGYVYIPGHYRWTPGGYIYVAGYWDLAMPRRGLIYAPAVVAPALLTVRVGPVGIGIGGGFVYTPGYAVTDTFLIDTLFVRPAYCHYYYGDWYGPRYAGWGFESAIYFGRNHYEPFIAYQRWSNPRWYDAHLTVIADRHAGRVALPPRTLAAMDRAHFAHMIAPAHMVMASRGERLVRLEHADRVRAKESAAALHRAVAEQRARTEVHGFAGNGVRTSSLSAPALNHAGAPAPKGAPPRTPPPHPAPHKDEKKR